MSTNYSPPVDKLLTLGDCREFKEWPNYLEMGIGHENIPNLIRMATDMELHWPDSESLEVWAPIHAWRALGQLQAEEAVEPLMQLFHELDDSDWAGEELPEVYGMIGRSAIPMLTYYLSNPSHELFPRVTAAHSLERIGTRDPDAKAECVNALVQQLERFKENDPTLNAFLISYLVDLKAVGTAPIIKHAFTSNRVDLSVQGDWEDVQVDLGLKEAKETPHLPLWKDTDSGYRDTRQGSNFKKARIKAKAKRKMAKKSRKKNRKWK